jgi:hypothetical protein
MLFKADKLLHVVVVFNTIFNNISVILWQSVLLVKKTQSIWREPLTNFIGAGQRMWALQKLRTLISAKSYQSLNINALLSSPSPDTSDPDSSQKSLVS